jgi:hypothetical protein
MLPQAPDLLACLLVSTLVLAAAATQPKTKRTGTRKGTEPKPHEWLEAFVRYQPEEQTKYPDAQDPKAEARWSDKRRGAQAIMGLVLYYVAPFCVRCVSRVAHH